MENLAILLPGQVTFFVMFGWTLSLWLLSEYLNYRGRKRTENEAVGNDLEDKAKSEDSLNGTMANKEHYAASKSTVEAIKDACSSGLVRCMLFDLEAIKQERATLKTMAEFGTLMLWYFLCDRTPVMGIAEKHYSRDLFLFLFLILTSIAFGSSLQTLKAPVLLARQQTEEWKGWMQVLFLLYHYFEAKEAYNAIRLFIAAYVWMTGFGNFSYYYKTGDYCIGRFCQMMWRLNFLVLFSCLVMGNSYMLYYICPMHTIFTILVYACLGLAPQLNQRNSLLFLKMVLCFAFVFLCWDIKPVFDAIWRPLTWLVGYVDPRKQNQDILYEWYFRSSLDRYVWIHGMFCAWLHPYAASFLAYVDNLSRFRRVLIRTILLKISCVAGYFWYINFYCLPKTQYNAVHPYTSWIPITLFIIVRNLTPTLRLSHLRLYGWLGCITLETYICQFHIWLKTIIENGQPKALMSVLPGYPLLNFVVVTAGYVFVSYRLFNITNALKNVAVPHSNDSLLLRNMLLMAIIGGSLYLSCYGVMALFIDH